MAFWIQVLNWGSPVAHVKSTNLGEISDFTRFAVGSRMNALYLPIRWVNIDRGSGEVCGRNDRWIVIWLVVWNMNGWFFHSVGNIIIPTDELIFFRGIETTNQVRFLPTKNADVETLLVHHPKSSIVHVDGISISASWRSIILGRIEPLGVRRYNHRIGWWENLQESPLYLMVKTMVSCKFSLKPIQWYKNWDGSSTSNHSRAPEGLKFDCTWAVTNHCGTPLLRALGIGTANWLSQLGLSPSY